MNIQELRKLMGEATSQMPLKAGQYLRPPIILQADGWPAGQTIQDLELRVAATNALPALLDIAEAAQGLRVTSKAIDAWIEDPGDLGSHDQMMRLIERHDEEQQKLDEALAKVQSQSENGSNQFAGG